MSTTTAPDLKTLRQVATRVLWLSTAIVDAANAGRPNETGLQSYSSRLKDLDTVEPDAYRLHGLDTEAIVDAALSVLGR